MATDRAEQNKRGQSYAKTTTKHRYAAIEHRVIDSPAFADLTFSAQSLLLLMARQLSKDNNGHLQATHSYMQGFGFSDRTLTRATKELVEHGFLYRTRMGGYQKGASQYAVTWLPIKKREGLNLEWFIACAWRIWKPDEKKSPPANLRACSRKNGGLPISIAAKNTAEVGVKFTDIETVPVVGVKTVRSTASPSARIPSEQQHEPANNYGAWLAPYFSRLASRGLAHACPASIQ